MRSICTFLAAAGVSLAAVLGLNLYFDPFGLVRAPVAEFIQENPRSCAIDKELLPEGAQKKLKIWLLEHTGADTIAVGSSRMQKVRRTDFATGKFVSFSFTGLAIDSYPGSPSLWQTFTP